MQQRKGQLGRHRLAQSCCIAQGVGVPNRWIKETYCASSRINAVGPEARDLWIRLLVNADDHGFFRGDAQFVASRCFPLQPNARKCEQLMGELNAAQLIVRYESGGKKYLAMTQWYERPRSKPKYPEPPKSLSEQLLGHENICEQVQTTESLHVHVHDHDHVHVTAPSEISLDAVGWHGISEQDRKTWAAAYPAVSVDGELARAKSWAEANPKNRKSNWRRFIAGWLDRAQNKAPAMGNGAAAPRRVAL